MEWKAVFHLVIIRRLIVALRLLNDLGNKFLLKKENSIRNFAFVCCAKFASFFSF